jgi:prolyl-tRNA editing enzyme YbaK/EbsC (Cys-tRNA(Pro) deacylase)
MDRELSGSARRVQEALALAGCALRVVELPASTRTAREAAAAVGCEVAYIAKSLVFKGARSGEPVLVVASGVNRVDEARVAEALGEPIAKADADYVRQHTGFAIGGVPPLGHATPLRTLLDADLFAYPNIWAAAGTPNAVFALTPADLARITGGTVLKVCGS